MINDAYVRVTCDKCQEIEDEIQLEAIACHGWDERNVDAALKRLGWKKEDGQWLCPNCVEEQEREDS